MLCAYHVGEDVVDCAVDCVEWGCLHGGGVWDLGAVIYLVAPAGFIVGIG